MSFGLELKNISKSYGAAAVLQDISLHVNAGELLVLLGPSGSGKSTLLRVIAGLIPGDSGEVIINGKDVSEIPPAKRNVAMVFQSYALFPHLTIFDNLAFGLQSRKVEKKLIAEKVQRVAEALRLDRFLQRYPREVSGGERQRVALGRALLREPSVFLMDEPLSNLDAQLRSQMRVEILRLHEQLESTMVYVTHDQLEALSMGDKVGVLRDGRLEQIGTAGEIYRHPRTLFVAQFIGNPMMNTVPIDEVSETHIIWRGHETAISPHQQAALKTAADKKLLLGIRAEHISIEGSRWAVGTPPKSLLSAVIRRVELAGDQQFLTLDVDGVTLTARCEPDMAVVNGGTVRIWFDAHNLHIFDEESGLSLAEETE